jgi:DUF1009 family protein
VSAPLGLIAGNGRFPLLIAREARRRGRRVVAVAIREEASPQIEAEADEAHWMSLGQLGKCIDTFHAAGVSEAVMAGQVKHRKIFSDIKPDLKLMAVLARLAFQNTDSLIGGVADALAKEGIRLVSSVALLADFMAAQGAMAGPLPDAEQQKNLAYGLRLARALTAVDVGQTVVVKNRAAVAVEAMEGTDEVVRRAASLAGAGCVVVKVAKPRQDLRFDVPVVGMATLEVLAQSQAALLGLEAGKTLIIDKPEFLAAANTLGISIWGIAGEAHD